MIQFDTVVDRQVALSVSYLEVDKVPVLKLLDSLVSNAEVVEALPFEWHQDMFWSCWWDGQEGTADIQAMFLFL